MKPSTNPEEKMYSEYRIHQHYKKMEQINNLSLQFITEMILCDCIKIQAIPFELRTYYRTFYLSAFRVSSYVSKKRLMDDIMLLYNDLQKDFEDKKYYMKMLLSTLEYYDFQGDKQFEIIKKNITEDKVP